MKRKSFLSDKYFLSLILLMLLVSGILFFNFIIHKRLYIFFDIGGDTRQSYWPMYKYIVDSIKEGTLKTWSFQIGLGTSTFTLYSFLFDPFTLLLFLFPAKYLTYGILIISIIKILISGTLFYWFLNLHSIKEYPAVITSLIWAFNGYMMLWGQHYWFATMLVLFTFIMLSLEFWLRRKRTYLFPISIALMAMNSPYFLFMISLFIFFYVIFHYLLTEETLNLKQLFLRLMRFLTSYFLGLGAGAMVFLPVSYLVLSSPRLSGSFLDGSILSLATYKEYISIFLRLFSNNTLGVGLSYFGSINYYEGPMLSSSLLFILALPQLLFAKIKLRHKMVYLLTVTLCLILFIYPFFSALFSAFSSFNYRWNFLVVFLNVLAIGNMLQYFSQKRPVSYFGILISALIVMIGWYFSYKVMILHHMIPDLYLKEDYFPLTALWIGAFLIFYSITLRLLHKNTAVLWIFLLCSVSSELIISNYPTINARLTVPVDVQEKKEGYFDYTNEAVKYIKSKDHGLFRIDKNYDSYSFNDALFQNYNGVKSYNSLNQPGYVNFLEMLDTGMINFQLGGGFNQRQVLRDLTGVKYILSKNENVPINYIKLKTFGDIYVYKNLNALPIGFTYDSYMNEEDFTKLMPFEKDYALMHAAIIENSYGLAKYTYQSNKSERIINKKFFTINNGENKNLENDNNFTIVTNSTDPEMMTRLPKNKNGWRIELEIKAPHKTNSQIFWARKNTNFNPTDSYTFEVTKTFKKVAYELDIRDMEGLRIDPGESAGTYTIKNLRITPINSQKNTLLTQNLAKNNVKIKEFSNDYLKGRVSVDKKKLLFLSIPYDKGWTVKIDGKEVKAKRVNMGFTGVVITKGSHTIELKYHQPLLRIGIILSVICWGILLWNTFFKKIKKES